MKTNLLIATAMLLSAAAFAQQADTKTTQSETVQAATIKSGSDASVQAYAITKVKSKAAGSVKNQVITVKKEAKKKTASVEKKPFGQAKSAIAKSQGAAEGNTRANASLQGNSGANAGSANNKLSQDASLNTGLKASSSDAKSRVDGLSQEGKATVQAKTNESLKTTATMKNEAVKSAGEIKQSVKPRPVSAKVHSQIKANAGIKIK